METQDTSFKTIISVKSENFDLDAIADYQLLLSIGEDALRIAVTDINTKYLLYAEDYQFPSNLLQSNELIAGLSRIFESHLFLKANFWHGITVSFRKSLFTLVPNEHFEEKAVLKYLKLTGEIPAETVCITTEQQTIDARNLFVADKEIINWLQDIVYPSCKIKFIHQTSALIEGIFQNNSGTYPVQMHVQVEKDHLVIIVNRNRVLELCNIFQYQSAQDFIYYVLFIIDELRLDPRTCKLNLYGQINTNSAIFELIHKYIQEISMSKEAPKKINFGASFDNFPFYKYFDLLSMAYL